MRHKLLWSLAAAVAVAASSGGLALLLLKPANAVEAKGQPEFRP